MKENTKIILITAIIVITLFSIVSFLLLKKEEQRAEDEYIFLMKKTCREIGNNLYEEEIVYIQDAEGVSFLNPEYHYNKELNTCLYAGGKIKTDYFEKWVKDIFTNKWIIAYITVGENPFTTGCPECLSTNKEFEQRKQELFNK